MYKTWLRWKMTENSRCCFVQIRQNYQWIENPISNCIIWFFACKKMKKEFQESLLTSLVDTTILICRSCWGDTRSIRIRSCFIQRSPTDWTHQWKPWDKRTFEKSNETTASHYESERIARRPSSANWNKAAITGTNQSTKCMEVRKTHGSYRKCVLFAWT